MNAEFNLETLKKDGFAYLKNRKMHLVAIIGGRMLMSLIKPDKIESVTDEIYSFYTDGTLAIYPELQLVNKPECLMTLKQDTNSVVICLDYDLRRDIGRITNKGKVQFCVTPDQHFYYKQWWDNGKCYNDAFSNGESDCVDLPGTEYKIDFGDFGICISSEKEREKTDNPSWWAVLIDQHMAEIWSIKNTIFEDFIQHHPSGAIKNYSRFNIITSEGFIYED